MHMGIPMDDSLLAVKGVSKTFGGVVRALDDISKDSKKELKNKNKEGKKADKQKKKSDKQQKKDKKSKKTLLPMLPVVVLLLD